MVKSETVALDERLARALLASAGLPGDEITAQLVRTLGAVETVKAALSDPPVLADMGVGRQELEHWYQRVSESLDPDRLGSILVETEATGAQLLIPGDPGWPHGMEMLGDHGPLALWVRGDVGALSDPAIGVIGTRAATGYGAHMAAELADGAASQGFTVVGTGAHGVAAAAHRATLLAGGRTIAVLPSGVDRLYPAGQTDLLEQIAQTGALVSELAPGAAPTRWTLMQRGRVITGLSSAVVVVEAGARSGALVHAAQSAEFGRPVGAIPGPVTSAVSVGSNRLLRDEIASLVTNIDDVTSLIRRAGGNLPRTLTAGSADHAHVASTSAPMPEQDRGL